MAGFKNEVMVAQNVNFGTVAAGAAEITADGQIMIGAAVAPFIRPGFLTSTGGTLNITLGPGTINMDLAGGSVGADSFAIDAATAPGVNPAVPTGLGLITINGAQAAAGTIGTSIQTRSVALNQFNIEVQRSSAAAFSTFALNGVSHFDNTQFTVDANGYVSMFNGLPVSSIDVDANTAPGTDPVVPTVAGVMGVSGAQVAAGVNPIRTNSIAANSYQIQVQRSSAQAASTLTANGIAHFDSASFGVDANGFVTFTGSGGMSWLDTAGGALAANTGYFVTAAAAITLPLTPAQGTIVEIVDQVGGGVVVTAAGANIIQVQNVASSAGGTSTSTQKGDALRLVFRTADLTWYCAPGAGGNWILA